MDGDRTAEKTEPEASGEPAGLADHIKTFLEENGRSTSMEITGEMAGLGYDQNAARDALQELKKRSKVRQLKDADGNPVNKYESDDEKYQECTECGSKEAGVYRANRGSCLVAECLNCGETIDSLQAGPEMIKR